MLTQLLLTFIFVMLANCFDEWIPSSPELCLLGEDVNRTLCHLYLALRSIRRAILHLVKGLRLLRNVRNNSSAAESLKRQGLLHLTTVPLEFCGSGPHLLNSAAGLCAFAVHVLQSPFRHCQETLVAQLDPEDRETWESEQKLQSEGTKMLSTWADL